jgi:GT2 family glycosyltransferase
MPHIRRSVIIPVFNGRRHLPVFWRSLIENSDCGTEIIVVDDGSDEPVRRLLAATGTTTVKYIRRDVALGFASAVNEGLSSARGDNICLLNSDLILPAGCLESLCETVQSDRRIGVAGAKLLYPQTGRIQHAGLAFTHTNHYHVFRHAAQQHPLVSKTRVVQAVAFAACAMRREIIDTIGLLDTTYINGYEDLDYCFRLRDAGFTSVADANATAFHWERQSGRARSALRKDNVARLWTKWGASIQPALLDYLAEALRVECARVPNISFAPYTIVNLSRGAAAAEVIALLKESGVVRIEDEWQINQRRTDEDHFWLPLLLPIDAGRHPNGFIYIVDELPQLEENHYWFELRRQCVDTELIVDLNANVVAIHGAGS